MPVHVFGLPYQGDISSRQYNRMRRFLSLVNLRWHCPWHDVIILLWLSLVRIIIRRIGILCWACAVALLLPVMARWLVCGGSRAFVTLRGIFPGRNSSVLDNVSIHSSEKRE
jgi:hypothetical protein